MQVCVAVLRRHARAWGSLCGETEGVGLNYRWGSGTDGQDKVGGSRDLRGSVRCTALTLRSDRNKKTNRKLKKTTVASTAQQLWLVSCLTLVSTISPGWAGFNCVVRGENMEWGKYILDVRCRHPCFRAKSIFTASLHHHKLFYFTDTELRVIVFALCDHTLCQSLHTRWVLTDMELKSSSTGAPQYL